MLREGEGTTFTIDRKLFTSDIWHSSPWKLKIWIYLLGNANHKQGKFMDIILERGQLIRSLRTIQNECSYKIGYRIKKPSLSIIRRICEDLTKELRITQRKTHLGTLFTIINYNKLQPKPKQRSALRRNCEGHNDDTVPEQNNNVNNVNNLLYSLYQENIVSIAEKIEKNVLRINPENKDLRQNRDKTLQSWCRDIDLAIRIDKRTPEQLEDILDWAINHEGNNGFSWANQVRSGKALRKYYDKMIVQKKNKGGKKELASFVEY